MLKNYLPDGRRGIKVKKRERDLFSPCNPYIPCVQGTVLGERESGEGGELGAVHSLAIPIASTNDKKNI